MEINHPSRRRNLDKISNLPTEVVDEIFKGMSISDVVKTSILSKYWRCKWMYMSELVFNDLSVPDSTNASERDSHRVHCVNNVLLLHCDIISTFELDYFLQQGCSDVDRWILVLLKKNLKNLILKFSGNNAYQIPSSLFSCRSLQTLILEGCKINLPSQIQIQGLINLTDLELRHVNMTNETFENLLRNVRLLRNLTVDNCDSLSQVSIHAPNLPQLQFIDLGIWRSDGISLCKVDEVLEGLDILCHVGLSNPIVEFVSLDDTAPKTLHTTYHHLKSMDIAINYEDLKELMAILCLCRSAPYLESLVLNAWNKPCATSGEAYFREKQMREEEVFCHLESAKLHMFKGSQNEIGFANFVLLNAVALKTMNVYWDDSLQGMEKELVPVLEKLMRCKRVSSEAEVIFSGFS